MRSFSTVLLYLLPCATLACGTVTNQEEPDAGDGQPGSNPGGEAGDGHTGTLQFGDASYGFGDMTVGQAGLPFSTRIVNNADRPLGPLALEVTGDHAADFVVDAKACAGVTLGVGSDCAITVSFAPKAEGARAASLVVATGAIRATMPVTGTGRKPGKLSITPSSQELENTAIGRTSPEIELTVTNNGDSALDAPSLSMGDAGFVVSPATCPARLGPAESCKVKVAFRPTLGGSQTTSLTATSGDQTGIASLRATGSGGVTVTTTGDGKANGTVTGNGIDCGTQCTATVSQRTLILNAGTTNSNTRFAGWSEPCGAAARCELPIEAATKQLTATFELIKHAVSVSTSGAAGRITSTDGFNCTGTSGTCQKTYVQGGSVTLKAEAGDNAAFSHWTGACQGVADATCDVAVNSGKTVSAVFKTVYTLSLTVTATEANGQPPSGRIEARVNGVVVKTCTTITRNCPVDVDGPASVTISHVENNNCTEFVGWTDCPGAGTGSCVLNLNADKSVNGAFRRKSSCTIQ